jgi:hypothetical protein
MRSVPTKHSSNRQCVPYQLNTVRIGLCKAKDCRAVAQAVSRRPLKAEARVGPCGIFGGPSGTGTGFSPSISGFPHQFHSAGAPLLGKMKKTDHLTLHLHHRVAQ